MAALVVATAVGLPATSDIVIRVSINGRIARLDLEDYVARVVAGEGQPKAADGAQQALAITARTYALANRNRHRAEGYDLCDTTHCQVLRAATDTTRRAARLTAGRVLTHQGQVASVYYSALCGGHSELASQVWPGADDSSSHLHEDEACRDEPEWTAEVPVAQIERALRAAGHRGQRLRDLRVVTRNTSGRAARLRVEGFTPAEVSGPDLRMALNRVLGAPSLRSTAFEVSRHGSRYRFRGTGYGHGVGLCVIGAGRRAARGGNAAAILNFYFPNLTVATYDATAPRRSTRASTNPPTRDDVVVALSPGEDRDRAQIETLLRTARDEVASATGRKPPAQLRVTVHSTLEGFMRATGQPWWTSGVTKGSQIDLPPLAILRERGQVELAIRREVAHVFVDSALEGRPRWVREGAASYFADTVAPVDGSGGRNCPKDDELLQPLSAGAHRNALARAEACFRSAIKRGKKWTDIP